MEVELKYESEELIPEEFKHMFIEDGGSYRALGAAEIKTEADINKLNISIRKERTLYESARSDLAEFNGLKPADVHAKLDRFEELESIAGNKGDLDETKIDELVEKRMKSRMAPIERDKNNLAKLNSDLNSQVQDMRTKETKRTVKDDIRIAAQKAKVLGSAMDDVLLLGENTFEINELDKVVTKDSSATPGINAETWLNDLKEEKTHWWPASKGAGAMGSEGGTAIGVKNNPFSKENWNFTEICRLQKEAPEKAKMYASAAGTTVGSFANAPAMSK